MTPEQERRSHAIQHAPDPHAGTLGPVVNAYAHDPEYIAERLALDVTEQALALMEQQTISQTELAERMGVSRAYVSRMLNAPPNLTLRSLAQLAIALGRSPAIQLARADLCSELGEADHDH